MSTLPENIRADRLVECRDCGAKPGEPCIDTPEPDISHFARRLLRFTTLGILKSERPQRGPWLVLEKEAVH